MLFALSAGLSLLKKKAVPAIAGLAKKIKAKKLNKKNAKKLSSRKSHTEAIDPPDPPENIDNPATHAATDLAALIAKVKGEQEQKSKTRGKGNFLSSLFSSSDEDGTEEKPLLDLSKKVKLPTLNFNHEVDPQATDNVKKTGIFIAIGLAILGLFLYFRKK